MEPARLRDLLQRLHDELGDVGSLDDESRELLAVVARDIDAVSADRTGTAGHAPALEQLAVRFESDHPTVSTALRALVDALAKAGI